MSRATAKGPKFVRYFGPVLGALRALGNSGTPSEVKERVATDLNLSEAELAETIPSGQTRVLFQCKKYSNGPVPKDEIMKFQAAVLRERAEKGLFLTTSVFTKSAREEALGGACEIELIDIRRLIELMESFKLGLIEQRAFVIEEAFFGEFLKE